MEKGTDHVEAALKLVQSTSDAIDKLDGVPDGWKAEALARLGSVADLLGPVTERFFLRTRMSLPFARRCEAAARTLDSVLAGQSSPLSGDAQQRLTAALDGLEKAAKTLDERSQMRGTVIT
jgi:hypothetical protein